MNPMDTTTSNNNNNDNNDMDKLRQAIQHLITHFGSLEKLWHSMGLTHLPMAQQYGIFWGCLTFTCTIGIVVLLLLVGGSFQRIQEQSKNKTNTSNTTYEQRPLLMEHLLAVRKWMTKRNYSSNKNNKDKPQNDDDDDDDIIMSPLTTMLCNVVPPKLLLLLDHNQQQQKPLQQQQQEQSSLVTLSIRNHQQQATTTLNDSYEILYKHAYRISQDSATGTSILPGRPEARYEAYARAYAGCCHAIPKNMTNTTTRTDKKNNNENDKNNNSTTTSFWSFQNKYRRSYARLYEATVCESISRDDIYGQRFLQSPQDIVGRYVRLQVLNETQHLQSLFDVTCGKATLSYKSYNAQQDLWFFLPQGPFPTVQDMLQSYIFGYSQNKCNTKTTTNKSNDDDAKNNKSNNDSNNNNENDNKDDSWNQQHELWERQHMAMFVIYHNITNELLGCIGICHDEPWNLSCQLHIPILPPQYQNTKYDLEAIYLLLDRCIGGYGYRRITLLLNQDDYKRQKQIASRTLFTYEGLCHRHSIHSMKEMNQNMILYTMLNSNWNHHHDGVRDTLFVKLYGKQALHADLQYEKQQAEREEQEWKMF